MKSVGTERIETERLILRRLTKDDYLEAYNNWCSDSEVCKYVTWDKHKSSDDTKKLFEIWERDYIDLNTYRWIVETIDTHELVGTIDVPDRKLYEYSTVQIGYCYGRKFWGKGYGTESLKAVITYLFEKASVDCIYAKYYSHNPASGRVMAKAKMTFEGFERSRIIDKDGIRNDIGSYSITKDEYFNK